MPGVAQVWLTQEELDALLRAAGRFDARVSRRVWDNLAPKLRDARNGLGCPVRIPLTREQIQQARKEGRLRELFMSAAAPPEGC